MTTERTDLHKESIHNALIDSRNTYQAMVDYTEEIYKTMTADTKDTVKKGDIPAYSNRLMLWSIFAEEVENHVCNYTVPQYGDFPNDQVTTAKDSDIIHDMQRYLNRYDSNSRGAKETDTDLLKIAHYASILWCKRMGFDEELRNILSEEANDEANNSELSA